MLGKIVETEIYIVSGGGVKEDRREVKLWSSFRVGIDNVSYFVTWREGKDEGETAAKSFPSAKADFVARAAALGLSENVQQHDSSQGVNHE